MPPFQKVIIIGAGPAGLAAALHLKNENRLSVAVYEIRSEPSTIGGAVGILSNGVRLLDRLGVYGDLSKRAAVNKKVVLHSSQGAELGEFDGTSWIEAQTGYGPLRAKRNDLQEIFLAKAAEMGIVIHNGKRLVSIESSEDGEILTFSDGTKDIADLVLGCDGIHSAVRTLYVDHEAVPEYSGLSVVFSFIPASDLPAISPAVSTTQATLTPDGLFLVTPCTASFDELFWFFSYELPISASQNTRDGWEEYKKANVEEIKSSLLNSLQNASGPWGTILKDIVRKTDHLRFYPIFKLPLGRKWSRGRCLLLGDAAHAMQPHAGQGVSMALEDVFLLSRILKAPNTTLSDVFQKFDKIRRPRIEKIYNHAAKNGDMRRKSSAWVYWLKETAIWAALLVFNFLNLQTWGFGQGDLAYDIDAVEIQ